MKHFFTLLFSLFFILQAQAQLWLPFYGEQLCYYRQKQADGSEKVETFLMDKYGIYNNLYSYIFNAKGDMPEECYTNLRKQFTSPYYINKDKMEYLPIAGANWDFWYINPGTTDFIEFKPMAAVGTSWTTRGLTFTCAEKVYKKVLGIDDSVKIFKCLTAPFDTIEIELSKGVGFTKFLPFNEFFDPTAQDGRSPYFELIGYQYDHVKVGYKQPGFSDYFPLNEGDELYWDHYNKKLQVETFDYYYDKVTKAYHSPDSVYYEFDRKMFQNGIVKENVKVSKYYLRSIYGEMLAGKTSWYGSTDAIPELPSFPNSSNAFWVGPIYFNEENDDTTSTIDFKILDWTINPSSCTFLGSNEQIYTYNWSTKEGMTYYRFETLGATDRMQLLGSVINGKKSGETEIITSVNKQLEDVTLIFPNPVSDILNLKLNRTAETVEVYDVNNNLLFKDNYSEKLDFRSLNPGVYILRINYSDESRFIRIVKQ